MSSVTLVHPAKAVVRNEMPFGRNTVALPIHSILHVTLALYKLFLLTYLLTVLHTGPVSPREGEIGGPEPPVRSDAAYGHITLAFVIITEAW